MWDYVEQAPSPRARSSKADDYVSKTEESRSDLLLMDSRTYLSAPNHSQPSSRDPEHNLLGPDGCWTIDAPAIFLSHVCKRWRAIATNSPNLWSSINIDVYRMPKDFRPLLKLYLCNAGKRPLRIRITDSQKSTWRQQGDYVADHLGFEGFEATWCLLRETRRLGALDLVLDEDFIYSPVSKATFIKEATSMSFPLLTCFNCSTFPDSLDNDRWFTEDDDDDASVDAEEDEVGSWFWDAIYENAPKLTSLVTDRLYNTQLLPYSQLTTLQIMRLNAHDWPHLLLTISTSLNLQNLSIHESYDPIDDDFSSISCCSLRTLRIEIWPVLRNLPRMFASLHLPSLRSFELHLLGPSVAEDALVCNAPESDWPCHTLLAISEACSATLTQLSVKTEDYAISANAMTRALAAMPNLVFLEVNAVRDAQESFAAGLVSGLMVEEARGGRDAVLMPKLRKLFVHETVSSSGGYSPYLEIAEDIVRMAELRSSLRSTSTLAILCLSHGSQKYTWDPAEVHVEFLGVGLVSRLEALEVNGTLCRVEWMSGSVDTENVTLG
ncbi:hypothetical protein Moror_3133 [Moniliophthora roreri MCA 2997]|uniref:F-box domain-containing protein n=2 Tax=Moniliophthora roreri TaxID=221103 RepID=V2WNZ7_MONRO|nr:hypothetical protein Moror_3133 [Moniliophthora roreri MCA 2997]